MKLTDEERYRVGIPGATATKMRHERLHPVFDGEGDRPHNLIALFKNENLAHAFTEMMNDLGFYPASKLELLAETETALRAEKEKAKTVEDNQLLQIDPDGSVHKIECEKCESLKSLLRECPGIPVRKIIVEEYQQYIGEGKGTYSDWLKRGEVDVAKLLARFIDEYNVWSDKITATLEEK